jgi:hypothetical protein
MGTEYLANQANDFISESAEGTSGSLSPASGARN